MAELKGVLTPPAPAPAIYLICEWTRLYIHMASNQTYHYPLGTALDRVIQHITRHIQIGIQDIHPRNNGDIANIHHVLPRGRRGRVEEERRVGDDLAQVSHLQGLEGIHCIGIGLGDIVSGGDAVVHDDHGAPIACLGTSSHRHGLKEIIRTIRRDGGGGPHGADDDNRLAAVDGGIHEEGRFLKGVRAVGDDCTGHGGIIADDLVDLFGQFDEDGRGDVFTADVGDLHTGHVSLGGDERHGIDEGFHAHGTGLVACCRGGVGV